MRLASIVMFLLTSVVHGLDKRSIHLAGMTFDTRTQPTLSKFELLSINDMKNHYLLHFEPTGAKQVEQELLEFFGTAGQYIPMNTFLVFSSGDEVHRFSTASKQLKWVGVLPTQAKYLNALKQRGHAKFGTQGQQQPYQSTGQLTGHLVARVSTNNIDETEQLAHAWRQNCPWPTAVEFHAIPDGQIMTKIDESLWDEVIEFLANQPEVYVVAPPVVNHMHMATSNYVIQGNKADQFPVWQQGILGNNQVIAVADSGLDYYSLYFHDAAQAVTFDGTVNAAHRKILTLFKFKCNTGQAYLSRVDGSRVDSCTFNGDDTDEVAGHGTHVAGCATGHKQGSVPTAVPLAGSAPMAKLVFMDISPNDQNNPGLFLAPAALKTDMLQKMENVDSQVRIHTHSWGTNCLADPSCQFGVRAISYNSQSNFADDYLFNNAESVIIFSAGNDGEHGAGTIAAPANAKNVIAIGASEKGKDAMAYFSSYGPTYDGRVKPDLVAPGHGIFAANSNGNRQGVTTPETVEKYGTSMAAPTAAGAVALVRQYLQEGRYVDGTQQQQYGIAAPSGVLLKALMILSADFMQTPEDKGGHPPSQRQGWGRINLDNILFPTNGSLWFSTQYVPQGSTTSQFSSAGSRMSTTYCFRLSRPGRLKVVLYWHDPQSSTTADTNVTSLVMNDLDLTLHSGVSVWHGNLQAEYDKMHNIEVIDLAAAQEDRYQVTVTLEGTTGAINNLPFVVAIMGHFASPPSASDCPPSCPTVNGFPCSGAGVCYSGSCNCNSNYFGADCGTFVGDPVIPNFYVTTKPNECTIAGGCGTTCFDDDINGHFSSSSGGTCDICKTNFYPPGVCTVNVTCSSHGAFANGACTCHTYDHAAGTGQWSGPSCNKCADGWAGSNCDCNITACNGHGICEADGCDCLSSPTAGYWVRKGDRSQCQCADGWFGPECKYNMSCSGHGTFNGQHCVCDPRYGGVECNQCHADFSAASYPACKCYKECPKRTMVAGVLRYGCQADGTCECEAGFVGLGCFCAETAGTVCSGHGSCGWAGCTCFQNDTMGYWDGSDCSTCVLGWAQPNLGCTCPKVKIYAQQSTPENTCGHGTCTVDGCQCHADGVLGYWKIPSGAVGTNKACTLCKDGWVGPVKNGLQSGCACQTPQSWTLDDSQNWETNAAVGARLCSGHGTCKDTGCECYADFARGHWTGANCEQCAPGWSGTKCNCYEKCGGYAGVCEDNGCLCHNNTIKGRFFYNSSIPGSGYDMTTGLSSDCDACLPGYTGHDPNTKCLCRGANCYSVAYDPTKAYPTPDTPISFALDEGNLSVYVDYKAGALGPVSTSFQIQPVTLDQVLHPSKSAPMAQIYVGPSAFYLRSLTPDQTAPQHGKFALQALTDVTLQLKVPYPDVSVAKAGASWLDALKIDYAVHPPVLLWRSPDGWTPAHDTCKTPEADKMISQLLQTTICRLEDEMQFSLFVKVSDTFPWWVYFSVGAVLVAVLLIIMSIVLCYRRRVGNERAKAEAKARVIAYLTQNKNKMGKSLRRRLGLSSSQKFTPEMAAQRFLQKHDKVQKMIARMNKPAERRRSLMLPPGGSMEVGSRPEMSSIESLQMITDAQMVGETWQFQPHEVALLEACTKLRSLFRQDPFTKEYALKPSAFPEMQQKLLLLQMENDKLKKVIGSHNPGVVYPRM